MKKRLAHIILTIALSFFVALAMPVNSLAFGDYNDYDYDSDSSSDSSDDYDSWESDSRDSDSSSFTGSSAPSRETAIMSVLILVAFVVIVISLALAFYFFSKSEEQKRKDLQKKEKRKAKPLTQVYIPNRTDEIEQIIKESDFDFDAHEFILSAKNIYRSMQKCWCDKDLEPLKNVLHRNLYEQSDRQIQMKINQGITQVLENITVNEAYLTCYKRDYEYEYIRVYLNSSMIDYQISDATGEIRYGDKTTKWTMRYDMTFMRSVGVKTASKEEKMICPNCGTEIDGVYFGICSGCGSMVINENHSWVVSDFKAIKDNFNDTGIENF